MMLINWDTVADLDPDTVEQETLHWITMPMQKATVAAALKAIARDESLHGSPCPGLIC